MRKPRPDEGSTTRLGALWRATFALATAVFLAACTSAPVGVAPNLRGTYWEHALVTNPNGGGPQVVRWGPADPYFTDPGG
ncbi:MAG TPA: hypothetical protein VK741_26370 [Acetobacteraceae bacterium]|jgi:hypothetical protein|nr:hypothetical protein [Acetobacteraceae bacterium]